MRSIWFVAGAGVGVYAMVRARRMVEALTPEGVHDRLAGLQVGWQLFSDEVRTGMIEKETELRKRLFLGLDGPPEIRGPADTPALPAPRPEGTDQS